MRVFGRLLSTAALLWGFIQAPFLHIHPEDLDHPPAPALGHLHLHELLPGPTPLISTHTDDDDAVDVGWNPLPVCFAAIPIARAASELPVPGPRLVSALPPVPEQRAHDPPDASPLQSRAPPA